MVRHNIFKPEVLLIEPEALSCQYVVQALQSLDLHLRVEISTQEVQEQEPSTSVHLVILGLDIHMKENLLQLDQIRQHCPGAVIMGICPRMMPTERIALLNAGLDFIIEKPFFAEECASAVQAVLRRLAPLQKLPLRHPPQSSISDEKP